MVRSLVVLLAVALVAAGCAQGGSGTAVDDGSSTPPPEPGVDRPTASSPHVDELVAGLNDVGYRLFALAADGAVTDVVLSPLSIGVAFGMAGAGATGATAERLAELFAYPADGEDRWAAFNVLEQDVTAEGGPVVRLANREFPDRSFRTAQGYDELLQRWFGADVEPLPLQEQPERSRTRINEWVSERTEGLIGELVPAGAIGPDSVLLLVNALYLEARWALPFGKYPTRDAPFTRLDGSTVRVPMMQERELSGPAVEAADYAATEVPYEGGELSMLVVVPEDGRYADVEARLGRGLVDEIDAAAQEVPVHLELPRFTSDSSIDLRASFEALGAGELFGATGWDGIAEGITLEQALHGASIAVDETGTVAAAGTALGFQESGPPSPQVVVRADRPFLYLIRHAPTGAVLFVGRVLDPAA